MFLNDTEWESTLSPSTLKLPTMLQSWVQTPFPQYDAAKLMVKGSKLPGSFHSSSTNLHHYHHHKNLHRRKHHSTCFCHQAYDGDIEQESSSGEEDDDECMEEHERRSHSTGHLNYCEHVSRSPTRRPKRSKESASSKFHTVSVNLPVLSTHKIWHFKEVYQSCLTIYLHFLNAELLVNSCRRATRKVKSETSEKWSRTLVYFSKLG